VFDEKIGKARAAWRRSPTWRSRGLKKGGEKVFTAPRGSVLRSFVLNHSVHHRAQLGLYLRMLDVPVPAMRPDGRHRVASRRAASPASSPPRAAPPRSTAGRRPQVHELQHTGRAARR
jgi:hypothetical protein